SPGTSRPGWGPISARTTPLSSPPSSVPALQPQTPVSRSSPMVFSSDTFLFLFLPLFLALYYLTPFRYRSALILAGSWTFYGWWRIDFLGLLILTTLWTYGFGRIIAANLGTRRATWACAIGTAGCLSVLGVFKYLNFF